MTQWKMGHTCDDCSFFDYGYATIGEMPHGKCVNRESDHFCHILSPSHPKCNVFEKRDGIE
jgi:hypothetical protein